MIWDWELGVLTFALGFGVGLLVTWQMAPRNDRIRELEKELETTQAELVSYRDKVNLHFQTTATLFEDMTERYRAVYQHLASGAQELCAEQPAALQVDLDAQARLIPTPSADSHAESAATDTDAAAEDLAGTASRPPASGTADNYGDAPNIPELTEEIDVTADADDRRRTAGATR